MLKALIVFASLLTVSSAIIDGTIAGPNEFPFAVSLQWDGKHKCGGTLIDANTILTAAHCYATVWVDPKQSSRVTALLGSRDENSDGSYPSARVGIKRIIWHPEFPDKYKSREALFKTSVLTIVSVDFMLLKMNRSVQENNFIKYATLAGDNNGVQLMPQNGDKCVVVGWGVSKSTKSLGKVTKNKASRSPRQLRKGLVTIIPTEDCSKTPLKGSLCAKEVKGAICHGDTGGPLICSSSTGLDYVACVSEAATTPCHNPNDAMLFNRVVPIRDWINKQI